MIYGYINTTARAYMEGMTLRDRADIAGDRRRSGYPARLAPLGVWSELARAAGRGALAPDLERSRDCTEPESAVHLAHQKCGERGLEA